MSTIYRFKIPPAAEELSHQSALAEHLGDLLLLGYFSEGDFLVDPTHFLLSEPGAIKQKLIPEPRDCLWNDPDGITTKNELKELRRSEDVDRYYDIDVLRMSEPRIPFIANALKLINRLPNKQREMAFADSLSPTFGVRTSCSSKRPEKSVAEAFQFHLANIMGSVLFFEGDRQLFPTSFTFRRYPERDDSSISISKMREETIMFGFLKHFSEIASFEIVNNKIVSFILREYEHWLEPSSGEPFEVLPVLSRDCNAKCDFCYVLGNPRNTAIKLVPFSQSASGNEASIRLHYFNKGKKLPLPTYDTEEIITHPRFFEVCEGIRKASPKCISITTNGYMLSESNLLRLKALSPVDISLSLNAKDLDVRKWLMGGSFRKGLEALPLLDKHKIPCAVTIAAWPRVPIEEIIETVRYADQFNVRSISVLLGGHTKLFPNPPDYPIPGYWNYVIDRLAPVRTTLQTPFILQPRLYEEQYRFGESLGRCRVTGVSKFSPASFAGMRIYDEIVAINGKNLTTRNECLGMLALYRERNEDAVLTISRETSTLDVKLKCDAEGDRYIYGRPFNDRFGIHLIGENIRLASVREIFARVRFHKAKKVLFLTSLVVRPFLSQLIQELGFLCANEEVEFDLQIPPNCFLGGNIVMGDMLVLDDFFSFIDDYLSSNLDIDLVLLPSGPFNHGNWLRDMKGQPFELLRRAYKVPVELIKAPYFE